GLSTPAFPVADTDRAMATGAGRVIALVDHTKIGRRSSVLTVPTDDIQHLSRIRRARRSSWTPCVKPGSRSTRSEASTTPSVRILSDTRPLSDTHALSDTRALSRARSEEHTSELQSRFDLVCRLLLEKKNKK